MHVQIGCHVLTSTVSVKYYYVDSNELAFWCHALCPTLTFTSLTEDIFLFHLEGGKGKKRLCSCT